MRRSMALDPVVENHRSVDYADELLIRYVNARYCKNRTIKKFRRGGRRINLLHQTVTVNESKFDNNCRYMDTIRHI